VRIGKIATGSKTMRQGAMKDSELAASKAPSEVFFRGNACLCTIGVLIGGREVGHINAWNDGRPYDLVLEMQHPTNPYIPYVQIDTYSTWDHVLAALRDPTAPGRIYVRT
jgi:hypothetical protein